MDRDRPNPKAPLEVSIHQNGGMVMKCGLYKGRLNLSAKTGEYHCSIHEKDIYNTGEIYIATLSHTDLLQLIAEAALELALYQEAAEQIEGRNVHKSPRNRRPLL